MTSSHRSPTLDRGPSPRQAPARRRGPGPRDRRERFRARLEALEPRALLASYLPAVADYTGEGKAQLAVLSRNDDFVTNPSAAAPLLIQSATSSLALGYNLGLTGPDKPVSADFEGVGHAQPAVYGFLDDAVYGTYYGNNPYYTGPKPFPTGSGRFAYIPTDGNYPATPAGSVNGTVNTILAKVVVVNLGLAGDLPAVAAYDANHKAEFAVYEPGAGRFLYYPSATFNPTASPADPAHQPVAVNLGGPGNVPASADYQGAGYADFAVYDSSKGLFQVRPADGGPTVVVPLGGPGDIPVSADFEKVGHADFAVYDPSRGQFLYRPANGGPTVTVSVGAIGDIPVVGDYFGDGHADFATFTQATAQWHILRSPGGSVFNTSIPNPDSIPIQRTDDFATQKHAAYLARGGNPDVVFLGDSITDFYDKFYFPDWAARLSQFRASNQGVGGDSAQNIIARVQSGELATHPKVVVLQVGTNDVGELGHSAAESALSIKYLIDNIHAASPGSSILLVSPFPRGEFSASEPAAVRLANEQLATVTRDLDTNYLPAMAPDFNARASAGYVHGDFSLNLVTRLNTNPADPTNYYANPAAFTPDLLHPNYVGYDIWASSLAVPLRMLLGRAAVANDFSGTGVSEPAAYLPALGVLADRPITGGGDRLYPVGLAGAGQSLPAPGDYDGDGKTDPAVYLPNLGAFAYLPTGGGTFTTVPFGIAGAGNSLPSPGDYDGDGKTDLAVYLPKVGAFAVRPSRGGPDQIVPFGLPGPGQAIPAPGDYDGDGKTDLAVYLPAIGAFAIRPSRGGPDQIVPFGLPGAGQAIPAPGDYDGDGKTELAVYLPSLGAFAYRPANGGPDVIRPFGLPGAGQAIPAPGDYDGSGKTELAVYLPSMGAFVYRPANGAADRFVPFGIAGAGQSLPTSDPATNAFAAVPVPLPTPPVVATVHVAAVHPKGKRGRA